MKVRLTKIAQELGITYEEAQKLKGTKLDPTNYSGRGKGTWLTEEGARKLSLAIDIPAVVPEVLEARHIRDAPNPNWCYVVIKGFKGNPSTYPVAIPRRLHGKLNGKNFPIHAITDSTGTTYRHAQLTGRYN